MVFWDHRFLGVLPWSAAIIVTDLFGIEALDGIIVAVDTLYVSCTPTSEAVSDTATTVGFEFIDLGRDPIAIEHAATHRDPVTGETDDAPRDACLLPLDHHCMPGFGETLNRCDAALAGARQ